MASGVQARRLVTVVAAVVLGACSDGTIEPTTAASSPAGAGVPPTVARVTGVWLNTGNVYVVFQEDGRFAADPEDQHLFSTPYMEGTYDIEGNTITFTTIDTEICTEGDTSAWTASLPEPHKLEVEVIDPGEALCGWGSGDLEFIRYADA